jgi:two-component system phosphate regulon response regulator PhoB
MAKILIVEDESDLRELLSYNLRAAGYDVVEAGTVADARAAFRHERPELVLLDLMLPDLSGMELCKEIKRDPATAGTKVVMLTAKGDEIDRIVGFELGADDYVTKPFSLRELVLRVGAILRRDRAQEQDVLAAGTLRLDVPRHRVKVGDGEVALTALEFKLLHTLLSRRGRVQSRERLLEDVWEMRADLTTRTVDTHVKRLREKLGDAGPWIETVRGVGYRFSDREDAA